MKIWQLHEQLHKQEKQKDYNGITIHSDTVLAEQGNTSLWHNRFTHVLLIIAVGVAVYCNTLKTPFIFDDYANLVNNPAIKNFNCFPDVSRVFSMGIFGDVKSNMYLRPLGYFTFALNYAFDGLHPFGYHVTNLLIHICNAMLVYLFFFRILSASTPGSLGVEHPAKEKQYWYLPLFAALLFVSHPVQTQSVTYIIQRVVPLATFFYLGALLLYETSRTSPLLKMRSLAYLLSIGCTVLAMEAKEIAFTLPVVIFLYELMFFEGKLVRRCVKIIPFVLTMSIIPLKLLHLSNIQSQTTDNLQGAIGLRSDGGASAYEYLITQFGVITTYIRLLFFPVGQNLDYDYPLQKTFFSPDVIAPVLFLLLIVIAGVLLALRSRESRYGKVIAFGIFWFFITLSVESSIVPIKDLIFEHRMYLPSVGFFMALLSGIALAYRRYTGLGVSSSRVVTIGLSLVLMVLAITAIARNRVWQNEVTLWRDVVSKSPRKSRVHANLATALQTVNIAADATLSSGQRDVGDEKSLTESVYEYREAIRLDPNAVIAYTNLAEVLVIQKKYDEALNCLAAATTVQPDFPIPYIIRGKIHAAKGDLYGATQEYRRAIKIQPLYYEGYLRLANILAAQGYIREAIGEYEQVMRIFPDEKVRKRIEELRRN